MNNFQESGAQPLQRAPTIRLIAWELTRCCGYSCVHCRASASSGPYTGELTTAECEEVLKNIASFGNPVIILTGGEPLLRCDIFHIIEYGTALGLKMVMATCSSLLTVQIAARLKKAGVRRISLSIDSVDPQIHDQFRGFSGAFDAVMKGCQAARMATLEFQVNTTVTNDNVEQLPGLLKLAEREGAVAFHPFLLVPTGRAEGLEMMGLSAPVYEKVLHWICSQNVESKIAIKPTCAPHYCRIAAQRGVGARMKTGHDTMTRGCLGGHGFAFISHRGRVQMCGFLQECAGELRENGWDFRSVWESSPFFEQLRRKDQYGGRCGYCKYWKRCGGCRARAFAASGNCFSEEPFCLYQPQQAGSR